MEIIKMSSGTGVGSLASGTCDPCDPCGLDKCYDYCPTACLDYPDHPHAELVGDAQSSLDYIIVYELENMI